MSKQTRDQFLNQIGILEAQVAEEERLNPTPKNIIQLDHLIELLQSNDWDREEYKLVYSNGIDDQPVYEIEPENGEQYRYFDGFVCQIHKHKPTGICIERSFDFRHRTNEPENILVTPDEAISWQSELIIQNGGANIFNGYDGDNSSSDNNLDVLLKEHLTPQIIANFDLSIDSNLMYQPEYEYIDENIHSESDLHLQREEAEERNPANTFDLQKVRAVYAGMEGEHAQDFAFLGKRLAHAKNSDEFYELYLSYGGFLIWLEDEAIFIGKHVDDIPVEIKEPILSHVNKAMDDLWIEHAKHGELI